MAAERFRGEYPAEWIEIAKEVKSNAGGQCVRCGHEHDPKAGYVLTVHHLDNNKANVRWWNLAALCQRCHLRIQGKVILERAWILEHSDWFKPYVAGYYAYRSGLRDQEDYVVANMAALLAYGQSHIDVFQYYALEVQSASVEGD